MRINTQRLELSLKVVYYGPGLSGKTTNLSHLYQRYPAEQRGDLIKLDTETERTLFFDYFPASWGRIGKYKVRFDLFTVPGQSFYLATRQAVLEGVDGIVFVADSSPNREEANLLSRQDMIESLERRNRALADVPHVYQWNKRDATGATPVKMLERMLNPEKAESFEAVASEGKGVWETQEAILKKLMLSLAKKSDATGATSHG